MAAHDARDILSRHSLALSAEIARLEHRGERPEAMRRSEFRKAENRLEYSMIGSECLKKIGRFHTEYDRWRS